MSLTGWMKKKAPIGWSRRYFALDGAVLSWRLSPTHDSERNSLTLAADTKITRKNGVFTIESRGSKTYQLQPDPAEEEAWFAALSAAIESSKSAVAATPSPPTSAAAASTPTTSASAASAQAAETAKPSPPPENTPEQKPSAQEEEVPKTQQASNKPAENSGTKLPQELTHGQPHTTPTSIYSKGQQVTSGDEWRELRRQWGQKTTAAPDTKARREPGVVTTVRVFVSSTFVDEHGERDELVRRVFTELNSKLRDRWLQIVPVDLRWGVSAEETSVIQQTCLNEIDNCRVQPDEAPWFIGLRGERYGWVQPAYDAPEDYYHPENFDWLRHLKTHDQVSITSLEIYHGVIGCRRAAGEAAKGPHAFIFMRDPAFKRNVDPNMQWLFDFEHVPEDAKLPKATEQQYSRTASAAAYKEDLDLLNTQLKEAKDVCVWVDYHPTFGVPNDGSKVEKTGQLPSGKMFGVGYVGGLTDFGRSALKLLYDQLDKEYPKLPEGSALDVERVQHRAVVLYRSENFLGRETILDQLVAYTQSEDESVPLVVYGQPGCGKSALMAKLCRMLEAKLRVVTHIVGATLASQSLRGTLARLCQEVQEFIGETTPLPGRTDELRKMFFDLLERVAKAKDVAAGKRNLVLIIDAVNQMSANDEAHKLNWIPFPLPAHVRIIISTLPTENNCLANLRARKPSIKELEVPLLSQGEREELVVLSLARYHKKLTRDDKDKFLGNQMAMLMAKEEAGSPLYLTAAVEELRNFAVYEKMSTFLKEQLPGTVVALFNHLLDRLEQDHGRELVAQALSLIATSRAGIFELEVIQILDVMHWMEPPKSNFSRLYAGLKIFISSGGNGLLQFFHQQLLFIVRQRYIATEEQEQKVHQTLARYFKSKADPSGKGLWDGDYPRGFTELIYHLSRAKSWSALEACVCNLRYLAGRCSCASAYDLASDFLECSALAKAANHQWAGHYSEFQHFFLSNVQILDQFPEQTYARAACEVHGSAVSEAVLNNPFQKPLLQWINKPQVSNKGAIVTVMRVLEQTQYVTTDCCFSPKEDLLVATASFGRDKAARVFSTLNGQEKLTLHINEVDDLGCCAFSPDGMYAIVGLREDHGALRFFDAANGDPVFDLQGLEAAAQSIHFSQDGQRLCAVDKDNTVAVWNMKTRAIEAKGVIADAIECCFGEKDANLLVLTSNDQLYRYRLPKLDKKEELLAGKLHNHTGHVLVSPNRKYLAVSGVQQRNTFAVFDLSTQQEIFQHTYNTFSLTARFAFSKDSSLLAACSVSNDAALNELVIYDVQSKTQIAHTVPDVSSTGGLSFSDDAGQLAVAGGNGVVVVLDTAALKNTFNKKAGPEPLTHKSEVFSLDYTPDDAVILSSAQDMAMGGTSSRIICWDGSTGTDVTSHMLHVRGDRILAVNSMGDARYASADGTGYEAQPHEAAIFGYPNFVVQQKLPLGARNTEPHLMFFSPDDTLLYVFSKDWFGKGLDVMVFDLASEKQVGSFDNFGGEREELVAACMTCDGKHFLLASENRRVCVMETKKGRSVIKTAKDDEALDLRGLFAVAARRTQPLMGAVAGEREINDRVQNIVLIVKFAGTKFEKQHELVEVGQKFSACAFSSDDSLLLTAGSAGVAVYSTADWSLLARIGDVSIPVVLAVPHQPPANGTPFTFAAGYENGHVRLYSLVRSKDQYVPDSELLARSAEVVAAHRSDTAASSGSNEAGTGTAPANVIDARFVPVGEGQLGQLFIDGTRVVPTSDKIFYKTKWTTPTTTMSSNPEIKVLWDASNGACSVISAQVIAIGADGQPNFNVMYMPSAGAVMQSGVPVTFEPGKIMHMNNGAANMSCSRIEPGQYLVMVNFVGTQTDSIYAVVTVK